MPDQPPSALATPLLPRCERILARNFFTLQQICVKKIGRGRMSVPQGADRGFVDRICRFAPHGRVAVPGDRSAMSENDAVLPAAICRQKNLAFRVRLDKVRPFCWLIISERSSVVELHLAKVAVEGSNPFARSNPPAGGLPRRTHAPRVTKPGRTAHTARQRP